MTERADDLLSVLNEEQRRAVLEHEAPLLVLAGAGSGKTRVITTKIAYFIRELGCNPYSIMAVTFTNKAAKEMRQRLDRMADGAQYSMIRTFHAFGAWLLRRYAADLGLSAHFTIYDDEDAVTVLHSIYPDYKRKELKPIARWISRAKDYCLTPDDDLNSISMDSRFPTMYRAYEQKMRSIGNVDFGDLIMRSVELLRDNREIRRNVCSRFRVILVDEYQDSNVAQFKLLQQLYSEGTFLCVVGDDDQSIYRFRGAELRNILTFGDHFPGTKVVKLEQNYRSTGNILAIAAAVVKHNTGRHGKVLRTDREDGSKAALSFFEDQFAEAQYCAELVSKDHRYDDTAILYRTNAQSAAFETVFMRMKIPYKIIGALRFYDREEIKDALAILSLLLNPSDEVSFRRIANKPVRGIGPSSLSAVLSCAASSGGDCIEGMKLALEGKLKGKAKKGALEFLSAYERAGVRLDTVDLPVFTQETLKEFGLIEHYRQQDLIASTQKLNNLEELVNAVTIYPRGREGLVRFMETLELDPTTVGMHDPSSQPGVTLITMHNTKGLEFDRVIISGMEEGLFPGRASESDEDIEEERRIFYVSITRARDELYFTACRRRSLWGQTKYQMPSRFLKELPMEYVVTAGRPSSEFSGEAGYEITRRAGSREPSAFARRIVQDRTQKTERGEYAPGDRVFHDAYGNGYIVSSRIENGREMVVVGFDTGTRMQFITKYAPLEKIAKD